MKVLHVIPSVAPERGGPSAALRLIASSLAEAGLEVDVATTDDGSGRSGDPVAEPFRAGVPSYFVFPRQTRFYTFSWPLTCWLARSVKDYDVVHIHALFSYPAVPASLAARCSGVPYIVRPLGVLGRWGMENRHPWLKKASFRSIESHILRGAVAVHYTSDQERLEAANLGVTQTAVIVPNPVRGPGKRPPPQSGYLRSRYPELTGKKIVLFLSRLDAKKGLDLLLPAFHRVLTRQKDVALVIAGDGDSRLVGGLEQLAAELGITRSVIWTGFVDEDGKWSTFADADLFVLPSYSENFGIAVVEAMACGVPVIVSDQVAIHREISAAEAGVVVTCTVEAFSGAMLRTLDDSGLRARLGANGRMLAERKFSIERVTRDLVRVYKGILPAHAHGGC